MRVLACVFLVIIAFSSCKKDVSQLRRGQWSLRWDRGFFLTAGQIDFRSNGKGIFKLAGTDDKVPFNYTLLDNKATFQFVNPNFQNTVHKFDVVISSDTLQVWEEVSEFTKSTFVLRK